uniref:Uncharacterized protein n=1 Tax=Anguilla anguilla TaxID=7936 RepID=A0A0E9RAP4_ANGAN
MSFLEGTSQWSLLKTNSSLISGMNEANSLNRIIVKSRLKCVLSD